MQFIQAKDVDSPKPRWRFVETLLDRGEGQAVWAMGLWDGQPVIAYRWNGTEERPKGNPVSTGHATWMIMDSSDYPDLLAIFDSNRRERAKGFLGL